MASGSSGSALDEIFADKDLFVAHFGILRSEVAFGLDKSDLDVQLSDDDWEDSDSDNYGSEFIHN